MKKHILLIILLVFNLFLMEAQDSVRIAGRLINNTKYAKIVVKKFNVGSLDIAAFPIKNEKFTFAAPIDITPGVYRLQYSQSDQNAYIDVIIDGKEKVIDFTIDLNLTSKTPVFEVSEENKKWYTYKKESQQHIQKIQLISQFINQYPIHKDLLYQQAVTTYEKEISNYKAQEKDFLYHNKDTWAAIMIVNSPVIFTNPKDDIRIQDFYKKENYWNGIITTIPALINTPLYTNHILNYLQYYMNPEMEFSEKEQEEGFIKSVDIIIQKFSGNEATKKFAIQYLQLGFKELGNEKVLQYIDQKYKETLEQCQDETDKAAFDKRVQGYAAMKVGIKAPDVTFTTLDFNLHALAAERIIVVFWASWCPHCMEELPKLNEWALVNPTTKVVAISLDEDKTAYETARQKFPALIHDCDFKKWEGKAVNDYFVYGTPTFIVLDKDKNILGKYADFKTFQKIEK